QGAGPAVSLLRRLGADRRPRPGGRAARAGARGGMMSAASQPARPGAARRGSVVIAGSGTGGHLYPGLALADALGEQGFDVTFVGTASGIEARVVPAAGYPLRLLPGQQLRGGGARRAAAGLAAVARGAVRGRGLLGALRPRLV